MTISEPEVKSLLQTINPAAEATKQSHLESLYEADGRHVPSHPRYGLYTGLYQAEQKGILLERYRADLLDDFITWFKDNYGMSPGKHAQRSHTAFVEYRDRKNADLFT